MERDWQVLFCFVLHGVECEVRKDVVMQNIQEKEAGSD